jgi:glucose-1-phosphate cytidylyltransferase
MSNTRRIKRVEKYLESDINMLTYGEGLADINIKDLVDFHISHGKTVTISGVHPPARFGELLEKDGKVNVFQEKPQTSQGMINGGFMVFRKGVLDYLTEDEDCDFEVGPLVEIAILIFRQIIEHSFSEYHKTAVDHSLGCLRLLLKNIHLSIFFQ